jgi:hypothetical protein
VSSLLFPATKTVVSESKKIQCIKEGFEGKQTLFFPNIYINAGSCIYAIIKMARHTRELYVHLQRSI